MPAAWGSIPFWEDDFDLNGASGKSPIGDSDGTLRSSWMANETPVWVKVSKTYLDWQPDGTAQKQIEIYSLTARGFIHAVIVKPTVAFASPSITAAVMDVGTVANPDCLVFGSDVKAAPGDTVFDAVNSGRAFDWASTTSIKARLTLTDDVINGLNAGAVDFWILVSWPAA